MNYLDQINEDKKKIQALLRRLTKLVREYKKHGRRETFDIMESLVDRIVALSIGLQHYIKRMKIEENNKKKMIIR